MKLARFAGLVAVLALLVAGAAYAYGGGKGDVLRTRDQLRLKDGSCQTAALQTRAMDKLKTRAQDQLRLKDGSCQTASLQIRAMDKLKTRAQDQLRLKDGSCQTAALQSRTQDRIRLHDCWS